MDEDLAEGNNALLETPKYNVNSECNDMTSGYDQMGQVQSTLVDEATNRVIQLDNIIALCNFNKQICCSSECDCKTDKCSKEWLIDSGASLHFTNSLDDYVHYEQMTSQILVKTANSSALLRGKGTVILMLSNGERIRINPVYYIPDLTCQLLSMETFLKNGYSCIGSKASIKIMRGPKTFLTFYPRSEIDSIYVIKSHAAKSDIYMALNTIYGVDY